MDLNCISAACITSGLHGMGHWIESCEYKGDIELSVWLQACIDDFLIRYRQKEDANPSVIEYALDARSGHVM